MTGFPGETEAHFQALCDLIQEVGFDHLGVFFYSPEAGTPAAAWRPKVPRREARRRARLLKALQAKIVKARLKSLVGSVAEVLVEGVSPESDYLLTGRLPSQAPDIDGQVYITAGTGQVGEIQPVRLTRALPYDLLGEIVEGEKRGKGKRRKGLKCNGQDSTRHPPHQGIIPSGPKGFRNSPHIKSIPLFRSYPQLSEILKKYFKWQAVRNR